VPEGIFWRNGLPALMVKKGGLTPTAKHSLAAEVRQGAGPSPALEADSRADSSPHTPTVTATAGGATLVQHATTRRREDNPTTIGHFDECWTGEVERLFTAALHELRRGAEQALAGVEQRRIAEATELSRAIKKQHDIIDGLKREIIEVRHLAALKLAEAKEEADRMSAARAAWEKEKQELKQEAARHRSVAEQLADQLAVVKATEASKERQYIERLKEITAEVDRCLLRARAEWVSEVARMTDGADWQLPSFLKTP
jgi:dGTP triphosphohydrolase